jgi:curved DNA-binding protein CbpA
MELHDFDLYEVLGLTEDCQEDDVKRAYKKKALSHHPDRNGGHQSELFLRIKTAYDVLSDSGERGNYDALHHSRRLLSAREAACSSGAEPSPPREVVERLFELWAEVTCGIEAEAQHEQREGRGLARAVEEARMIRQREAGVLIDEGQLEQAHAILTEMLEDIRRALQPQEAAAVPPPAPRSAVPPVSAGSTEAASSEWPAPMHPGTTRRDADLMRASELEEEEEEEELARAPYELGQAVRAARAARAARVAARVAAEVAAEVAFAKDLRQICDGFAQVGKYLRRI